MFPIDFYLKFGPLLVGGLLIAISIMHFPTIYFLYLVIGILLFAWGLKRALTPKI